MPILPYLRGLASDAGTAMRPALRSLRQGHAPEISPDLVRQPAYKALLLALRRDHPATWRSLNYIGTAEEPGQMVVAGEYWPDRGQIWLSHERAFSDPRPVGLETLAHEFGHQRRALNPLVAFFDERRRRARGSAAGPGYTSDPNEVDARAFGYARAFDVLNPQQPPVVPWDVTYDAIRAARPQQALLAQILRGEDMDALRLALADVRDVDEPLIPLDAWQPSLPFPR